MECGRLKRRFHLLQSMTFDEAYDIDASISPKPNGALVRANHR